MHSFVLKNEELIRLDMDVRYFNLLFNDFYGDCSAEIMPNPGYVSKLFNDCQTFIGRAREIPVKDISPFEKLYRQNLLECLKGQYSFLDYYFLGEKIGNVRQFIRRIYRYDPERLREMFVAFDIGKDARMQQMGAVLVEHLIDASYGKYLEFLKSILPQMREEIIAFCFKEGVLPKGLHKGGPPHAIDYEMILDSEMGAGWDEDVRILTINPDKFRIYKYRDKVAVNPGVAEDYLIHEILHLAQGTYSSGLPLTLRQDSPQVRSISVAPITEGVATIFTRRLMEKRMEKGTSAGFEFDTSEGDGQKEFTRVQLRKTELDYLAAAIHFPQYRSLADDFYAYLALKQQDDEDFDAREAFKRAVSEHGDASRRVRRDLREKVELMPSVTDGSMYNLPYSISYHVGHDLVMDIEAEIVAKRGKAYLRSNRRRLQQIMLTGAWSVKLFKRWVKFALNRPDQFDTYVEEQVKTWSEHSRRPKITGKGLHVPRSALIPRGFDLEGYRGARLFK